MTQTTETVEAAAGALRLDRNEGVATLVLNRPDSHNAITLDMYRALPELFAEVEGDKDSLVLVIRGAGQKAFASGADISEFRQLRAEAESARAYNQHVAAAEHTLEQLTKPTIAAVHGYCIGGGCGIALACDLRFADEHSRFAITPAKLGLVYSLESTRRLVELVGPSRAKWMLMTGKQLGGTDALRLGLVDELTGSDELEQLAYEFAGSIATRAQYSVRATKDFVRRICAGQLVDDDETTRVRDTSFDTDDYAEGVRAFLEKRRPVFAWR